MLFPMLHVLYFYILLLPEDVCSGQYGFFFGSFPIMCFHNMVLRYFMNDFALVPVAPIITDITFVFTFQMHYISIEIF